MIRTLTTVPEEAQTRRAKLVNTKHPLGEFPFPYTMPRSFHLPVTILARVSSPIDPKFVAVGRQKRSQKQRGAFHPKSRQKNRKDSMNGSVFYLSPNEVIVDFPPPDSSPHGGTGKCLGGQLEVSYDIERCLPGSEIIVSTIGIKSHVELLIARTNNSPPPRQQLTRGSS